MNGGHTVVVVDDCISMNAIQSVLIETSLSRSYRSFLARLGGMGEFYPPYNGLDKFHNNAQASTTMKAFHESDVQEEPLPLHANGLQEL